MSNGSGVGGSNFDKNQHEQTRVANYDMHHTNEEGQTINIPAVPLSSICNIYNGEYISCSSGDNNTAGDIQITSKTEPQNIIS